MSLYIHQGNQKLLWETIHKKYFIHQYFMKSSPEEKINWFKIIIQQFYKKNEFQSLTRDDLLKINRETLQYMINDLKQKLSTYAPVSIPTQVPTPIQNEVPLVPVQNPGLLPSHTHNIPVTEFSRSVQSKQDLFNQQFTERQKEYNSMNQRELPKEITFAEKFEDEVITNMEELIQHQIKQREFELLKYSPVQTPENIPPPPVMYERTQPLLKLRETLPPETISTEVLILAPFQTITPPSKHVSWSKSPPDLMYCYKDEILTLTDKLEKQELLLTEFQKKMDEMSLIIQQFIPGSQSSFLNSEIKQENQEIQNEYSINSEVKNIISEMIDTISIKTFE